MYIYIYIYIYVQTLAQYHTAIINIMLASLCLAIKILNQLLVARLTSCNLFVSMFMSTVKGTENRTVRYQVFYSNN